MASRELKPHLNGRRIIAEARLRRNELQIERAIKRALSIHKAKAIAALRSQHLTAAAPPDGFDISSWDSSVDDEVAPDVGSVLDGLVTGTFTFLRLPPDMQGRILAELDISSRKDSFVAQVRTVGSEVAARLNDELAIGVAKGESIPELTKRIDDVFAIGDNIAERISRTETHGVAEATTHDSASAISDAGLSVTKTWVATEDSRTRPTHADADGQTVDVSDTFTVGDDELMYPGDESGSAEEVINCRCSTTYDMPSGDTIDTSASNDASEE